MANANANLHKAKEAKNDEFYTQLTDVSKEMMHYKEHFKDKVVFCNCDDPTWSAFWKYFHLNFAELGLKKLISTHYDREEATYKMEYEGGDDNNVKAGVKTPLEGNGDFRNQECLDLLDECDIVVTNPPFSLFREYVAVLMEHKKKFLIIGNMNALTYKEIFPLIRDNKLWYGASIHSGDRKFYIPDDYPLNASGCGVDEDGKRYVRVKGVRWYTNLDYDARHEKLILWKNYTSLEYPKYDNYDAINVNKYSEIPVDYDGVMGVPITFLDKYNPEQFEILGIMTGAKGEGLTNGNDGRAKFYVNGKGVYARILIRRKTGKTDLNSFAPQIGEKMKLFETILNESNSLYQQELYASLLMIVLSFPDICGSVEYPKKRSTKQKYKKWLIEYMGKYEEPDNPGDYADMIYELRCSLLHSGEGYNSVRYSENSGKKSPVNEFNLIIPDKKYTIPRLEESTLIHHYNEKMEFVYHNKKFNLDIKDFEWKIIRIVESYYEENKSKFENKFGNIIIAKNKSIFKGDEIL